MQRFISSTSGGPPAPATEASEETEGDAAVKWVRSTLSQLKCGVTKQKRTQAQKNMLYDSNYVRFWNRQGLIMVSEIRIVVNIVGEYNEKDAVSETASLGVMKCNVASDNDYKNIHT